MIGNILEQSSHMIIMHVCTNLNHRQTGGADMKREYHYYPQDHQKQSRKPDMHYMHQGHQNDPGKRHVRVKVSQGDKSIEYEGDPGDIYDTFNPMPNSKLPPPSFNYKRPPPAEKSIALKWKE